MRRLPPLRALALALVGLLTVSIGARPADPVRATAVVGGAFGGPAEVEHPEERPVVLVPSPPMSLAATRVWMKMQEKVALNFPQDTALEDILKYIRKATEDKDSFPKGLPIYVDPQGLQDADKTMASPASIDLDGIPLATTLNLVLGQLQMGYTIHEAGILFITDSKKIAESDANVRIMDRLSALQAEIRALREEIEERQQPADLPEDGRANPPPGGMGGGMRGTGGRM